MRTLPVFTLIAIHSLCSLLGHGGLHLVQDTGCQHHRCATCVLYDCSYQPCCKHQSQHSNGHDSHSQESRSEKRQTHFDQKHEVCLICQWHASCKVTVHLPLITFQASFSLDELPVRKTIADCSVANTACSRAPPLFSIQSFS